MSIPRPKSGSGKHPAVKTYRDKLDSIAENTGPSLQELDDELSRYLESVKTPIPPPLGEPMPEPSSRR
jgi:hypothetical protein